MFLFNNYSPDFKKYHNVEYMHLKIYMKIFLYSVTKVSVGRTFKECENIKLIHSLLQFKILCSE